MLIFFFAPFTASKKSTSTYTKISDPFVFLVYYFPKSPKNSLKSAKNSSSIDLLPPLRPLLKKSFIPPKGSNPPSPYYLKFKNYQILNSFNHRL